MSAPAAAPDQSAAVSPPPETPVAARPLGGTRPAWQRHPLFKLFSSVKLAVVLICVIIVASIAGTLYESSFDAKVARAYIYQAWWFNLWLTALCLNLICSAFSRWPWKRHHTGFLITHLGIVTLLIGAMIGRRWGVEGSITLTKGQPPSNQLVMDQRVLRVEEAGVEARQYPLEILGRHPTPAHPWSLGQTASGWQIQLMDYAPLIDARFEPQAAPPEMKELAQPAVRVRLATQRVGATVDQWLLAGDTDHGTLDLSGLASVELRRGVAPEPAAPAAGGAAAAVAAATGTAAPVMAAVDGAKNVNEAFLAMALNPGQGISIPSEGSAPSGATVGLNVDAASGKKTVSVAWRGATWDFDVDSEKSKDEDLSGSGLSVRVENYWPDFVMKDGKPATASADPRNPAVLVRVTGTLPAGSTDEPAVAVAAPQSAPPLAPGTPPPMGAGTQAGNQCVLYCDNQGNLTYTLKSRANPSGQRGVLKPGEPIPTGWMDWRLEAVQTIPSALARTTFHPVPTSLPQTNDQSATSGDPRVVAGGGGGSVDGMTAAVNRGQGVLVRLSKGGQSLEQWAATGWQVTLPTTPSPTRLAYDFQVDGLPIGLQLENFEVGFNEGTDSPASFKSTLKATDIDGGSGVGSCSMNQPFNYPGHWWNTFSGLTYKMSQAQWNPQDTDQSTIQILRDPGWTLKWVGSLLICAGVFTLFYLRPAKVPIKPVPSLQAASGQPGT